ncbi:MAG: AAA family ATPase [Mycoplasmoidaceae bacterium]
MSFRIKVNNDELKINNDKGAIIIGPNGSGKSKIIDTIYKTINKNNIISINEINDKDETKKTVEYKVKKIDGSSFLKEDYEGAKCYFNKSLKMVNDKCKSNHDEYYLEIDKKNIKQCNDCLEKEKLNDKRGVFEIHYKCDKYIHIQNINIFINFCGREYTLEHCSTGLKTLISLLINGIENNEKTFYLFDEIDAFLHPEWISLISEMIKEILLKENKIILVTHNPLFLAKLIKDNLEMISFVKWREKEGYGIIETLNWTKIIKKTKKENKKKLDSFAEENKNKLDSFAEENKNKNKKYIKNYIINTLTADTCRLFFDKNLLFVEGFNEQIYFNYKNYNHSVIQTGGFYQFPLIHFIMKEIKKINNDINDKYIMDNDKKKYNDDVFILLNKGNKKAYRLKGQFEEFYLGKKIKESRKKIESILNFVSMNNKEVDKEEMKNIEDFLGVKNGK